MQLWVQVIFEKEVATSNIILSRVTNHIFYVVQAHTEKGNTMLFLLVSLQQILELASHLASLFIVIFVYIEWSN